MAKELDRSFGDEPEENPNLDDELCVTLSLAAALARAYRHSVITVEHVLHELVENSSARKVLDSFQVDSEEMRTLLLCHLETLISAQEGNELWCSPPYVQAVGNVTTMAKKLPGKEKASGVHMLRAIIDVSDTYAAQILRRKNVTRHSIIPFLK